GKVIYVGKALNLKKRVLSYFSKKTHPEPKIDAILHFATSVDFVVTQNEMEALVVESNLVKRYKPRYNTRLKDDKSYPYLKISVKDPFPKAVFTRKLINDGARYYGPLSAASVRSALYTIRHTFRLCGCKLDLSKKYSRACLDYQIKRCMGPCIGAVSQREYKKVVKDVMAFLEGKSDEVLVRLKDDMAKAAAKEEFERAAFLRDQIGNIEKFITDQKIVPGGLQTEDFIALVRKGGHAVASVFMVRSGKLMGRENFVLLAPADDDDRDVLGGFFRQYYNMNQTIPGRINIPFNFDDEKVHVSWLKEKRGKRVTLKVPDRGERRRLLELASHNAALHLNEHLDKESTAQQVLESALKEIQEQLGLKRLPNRIECYDISNLGRDNLNRTAVASRVVFIGGNPAKDHYRRFRIKTVDGQDDYAMMEEILTRRLKNYRNDIKDEERIDLLLVDGGKGHLGVAGRVAQTFGLTDFDIAALAKREEELYRPDETHPVVLPGSSPGLFLLQRIRDEAHRFANEYQRHLRSKQLKISVLDSIPGLGPKRKEALIRKFKSVERISKLPSEELAQAPGIGSELAEMILAKLNPGAAE
ncbi:MAG: excinuclease ABC subunit UvrC, partial [bacterium]